jgi:Zn-dependent protease with chaperone function
MQIKHGFYYKQAFYGFIAVATCWLGSQLGPTKADGIVALGHQILGNPAISWYWLITSVLVLVVPGAIVLLLRRQALRADIAQLTVIGSNYLQWLHWLTFIIWLGWIGLSLTTESGNLLNLMLGVERNLWREGLELGLVVLPPILTIAGCYRVSYPVLVRIGSTARTKAEFMQQVVWEQFQGFLPLILFFSGCRLFFTQQLSLAVGLLGTACISRVLLTQLARKGSIITQSLTTGELRDRIFGLAQLAGVELNQVYVMPASQGRIVNAFAVQGGNVVLTSDLLHYLSKREIDAVIAHELAHLQYKHPRTLQAILVATVIGTMLSLSVLASWWWGRLMIPAIVMVLLWFYYACSRRFEYEADRQAAFLTQDPTALIAGLVKLARLSNIPLAWGRWGLLMSHPSMQQRIQALAHCYGINVKQIEQLLAPIERQTHYKQTDHYSIPAPIANASLIFSTSLKQKASLRLTWMVIASLVLPPTLIAAYAAHQNSSLETQWLLHLIGMISAIALLLMVLNVAPRWGYGKLRQSLSRSLQQQGVPEDSIWVGLAPFVAPRLFEGNPSWDMGFLFLRNDCLCYVGEQTRFALRADQITKISLAQNIPGWWPSLGLCLEWQDEQQHGTLRLQPYDLRSYRLLNQYVQQLKQQIELGNAQPLLKEISLPFAGLSLPNWSAVTSQSPDCKMVMSQFLSYLMLLIPITLGLSILLHLPWGWQAGSWLYLMAVGVGGVSFQLLPIWLWGIRREGTVKNRLFGAR